MQNSGGDGEKPAGNDPLQPPEYAEPKEMIDEPKIELEEEQPSPDEKENPE